jgi:hypothetical protein
MKLADAYGYYVRHSTKASDVARQLALAGLAVVWIFKTDQGGGAYAVPHALLWPSVLMMGTLACDLLQYGAAAALWGGYNRLKERQLFEETKTAKTSGATNVPEAKDREFLAPTWLNWPGLAFFWGKLVLVTVGYVLLLRFVISAIHI